MGKCAIWCIPEGNVSSWVTRSQQIATKNLYLQQQTWSWIAHMQIQKSINKTWVHKSGNRTQKISASCTILGNRDLLWLNHLNLSFTSSNFAQFSKLSLKPRWPNNSILSTESLFCTNQFTYFIRLSNLNSTHIYPFFQQFLLPHKRGETQRHMTQRHMAEHLYHCSPPHPPPPKAI